jgi:hypothetical protein
VLKLANKVEPPRPFSITSDIVATQPELRDTQGQGDVKHGLGGIHRSLKGCAGTPTDDIETDGTSTTQEVNTNYLSGLMQTGLADNGVDLNAEDETQLYGFDPSLPIRRTIL